MGFDAAFYAYAYPEPEGSRRLPPAQRKRTTTIRCGNSRCPTNRCGSCARPARH
ncbi:MAG: hypothetical protein M3041_08475 [Acidobacteriota bacterium]|nr:hypothetical protein [Acidobacteriota bacterium]